jgi:hypothetical protein
MLLLLDVSLFHLPSLLLMMLFDLLPSGVVSILPRHPLMILLLFLLEFLVLLVLSCAELFLLLLVFLIQLLIACIWCSWPLVGWKVARMYSISGVREITLRPPLFRSITIGSGVIGSPSLSGRHDPAFPEGSRSRTRGDRRPAVID